MTTGLLVAVAAALPVGTARADSGVVVVASVDGHAVADADANNPLVLHPADDTLVRVEVANHGSSPVEVRSVRLRAKVLGLAFFSYTTRVDLTVAPGSTGTRTFALDLSDLDGQATGLLPAEVDALAPGHTVLASQRATVDVKGKLLSVYGVFGLAVAGIVLLLLVTLGLRLVRRTLPDSRWSRASLFAVPGLGLGLVAVFTLGALRVLVPAQGTALVLLAGGTVVGLVLGYLTPAPGDEADRDELDARDVVEVVEDVPEVPAVPAQHQRGPDAPVPNAPAPATTALAVPPAEAPPPPLTTQVAPDDVPPPP